MRNSVKYFLVFSAFFMGNSTANGIEGFCPYIGIDGIWQHTPLKGIYNNTFNALNYDFSRNYWGGNIYLGGRTCDYWGLEAGYSQTAKKSKTTTDISPNSVSLTKVTKNRFTSWHVDLNGYLPLNECWELIGSFGIAAVKPKVQITIAPTRTNLSLNFPITNKTRAVFRFGVGAQYMATENFGIRGLVRCETTSALRLSLGNTNFKPFKDSISASLGVFWIFK